ncbi:MAG: hypothetical protein IPK50_09095 [Fibrobacterota bacterium]|nr:hypothetical protein [Fibrobacterota bacterium]QQS07033.1 MAG: hypothetical protein IPK50_09095 [Fibrobacterota bacterium]
MNRIQLAALLYSALAGATDLIQFEANRPAVAREVNENFTRLDTAIQNRATKSSLESTDGALKSVLSTVGQLQSGKVDQSEFTKAVGAKADSSALGSLARKQRADSSSLGSAIKGSLTSANLSGIRDSLKLKQDALGFAPLSSDGGTVKGDLKVEKTLSVGSFDASVLKVDTLLVPGARYQVYPDGSGGAIYADKAGVPGNTNYVMAWQRDGGGVYIRSADKYLGTRSSQSYPVYNDGLADRAVLHTGMFDTTRYMKTDAVVLKGNEANDITTKINPNGQMKSLGNSYSSIRNALDFAWYSSHWQIGNMRGPNVNSEGFGISQGDSALKFLVREGGATVYGNLNVTGTISSAAAIAANSASLGDVRVTGTLTTAPGATPADYVFEPDYKLSPLAEVEAFTKERKHLPEVPSAAEMTENGVDLAKMNMVLLKKVEELTLHAIAQEKRLDQQERMIEQLREERSNR